LTVRRSRLGRCASAFKACTNASTCAASLPGTPRRRYFGAAPALALSHFLIVLRDRLVSLAISLIDLPSRKCIARTLPSKAMVITSRIPLPQNAAE
jgi:hypothetical protein